MDWRVGQPLTFRVRQAKSTAKSGCATFGARPPFPSSYVGGGFVIGLSGWFWHA